MAAPSGTENLALTYAAVERLLREVPWEFQFFQAVRLFERLYPERAPVGRFVTPSKEVVRFAAHASMAFPASQIQGVEWPEETGAPAVVVNFMGLTGPQGVLPLYYTELILERLRSKDHAIRGFLDIFNHRMISLFYQAWEKYRFTIAYERGERDRFSHHLLDLIGLGTPGLQDRQQVLDDSLLYYAGLLSLHTRPAAALRNILSDYFDAPVEMEEFVGAWHLLDEPTQCRFEKGGTSSEQLGLGAIVGDAMWDLQSGVRIRLGPLTLAQYLEFLPDGSAYKPLCDLVQFYSGGMFDFEVQLILKRGEVPLCELGRQDGGGPRLGWVSWSRSAEMQRDPGHTILRISRGK